MKILQMMGPSEAEILDVPTPVPEPGEVLMRVDAVTTCPQWDLHLRHNDPMFVGHRFHYPYTPGQPGHEAVGRIVDVGPNVTSLKPGTRVCAWRDAGHNRPGCYAQFVTQRVENVIPVPEELSVERLASLELAMCVGASFLVLRQMNAMDFSPFAVNGLGPAGLVAVQMAVAEGAKEVIGFDLLPKRRDLALALGASTCFDPEVDDPLDHPLRPAKPRIYAAIDCVGAKASVEFLLDRVVYAVALFGVQREDYTFAPRHNSVLRLCGYPGHGRAAAEYALGLIKSKKLDLSRLVTHTFPLERYGEAIDLLEAREAVKICFTPWE